MIRFPTSIEEAATTAGSVRAGGTDLQERRRHGLASGDLVDLRDLEGLDAIEVRDGRLHIGALATMADLAAHPGAQLWKGLVEASGGLATPQIRNRGTVGGNLLQQVRCWYYRSPHLTCAKKGGARCLARHGDALNHALYDRGGCIAPHPSTLAVALWAYDAVIVLDGDERRTIPELLGPGREPTQTHALPEGRLVVGIEVPMPPVGEGAAYKRAISRARAEWPLVEVTARCVRVGTALGGVVLTVGAIENRPVRLDSLSEVLNGAQPGAMAGLVEQALAEPGNLPQTAYKLDLLRATVVDTLSEAWRRAGSTG
ncbi:MAG: FAD binding domain-containing protein [Alphaproteobacteria bacterium]|nr:FAD binding domain-containing protein [Alphaproteobacteria bacterium]